jgi:hypothetical protein
MLTSLFDSKIPDEVFEQLRAASDEITAREFARLTDLHRVWLESKPSVVHRIADRLRATEVRPVEIHFPATVLPEKALNPSTDLLPNNYETSGKNLPMK